MAAQINQIRAETRVEMKKLEDRADAGSAAAIAVGNLGQAYQPGQGAGIHWQRRLARKGRFCCRSIESIRQRQLAGERFCCRRI